MGEGGERRTQNGVKRKDTGDLTSLCKGELDKWQIGERRRGGAWKSQTALLEGKTKRLDLQQQGCCVNKQKRIRREEKLKFRGNLREKRAE